MGLDISIRFKRKGAEPLEYIEDNTCEGLMHPVYADDDIQSGRDFNGRHEFRCIPDFVTNERYGKYIDLESTSEDYKKLLKMIEESMAEDYEYDKNQDDFLWFLDSSSNSIYTLYGMLLKAPLYERFGWILQLEADW